ncbi:MAG: hypothetical protein CL681_10410 [Blastopirellula sp.]|nr:hypothetical protein [Blastopirellula sp.]
MFTPLRLLTSIVCILAVAPCFADGVPEAIALPVPAEEGVKVVSRVSVVKAPAACCTPEVVYRQAHLLCRRICVERASTTLIVKDECTSCCYAIPVCVPVCCLEGGCVTERCGLLGRRVIVYTWDCGFKLEIVMRARGDVLVVYHG